MKNFQEKIALEIDVNRLGVLVAPLRATAAKRLFGRANINMAVARIQSGEAEVAIAGGADAPITPLTMASFASAGLSSCANDHPHRASRPYDQESDSGVISEGSAVVVVESLEHAMARGARVYLEITGYSAQMDHDANDPFVGLENAMRLAMQRHNR